MAATNINQIFKQIKEDFVEISKNAAKSAANKAQKDIREKADQFIKEYYGYQPKVYKRRKKALYKLIKDHYVEVESAKGIMIEFGVIYDPSQIEGMHTSNSWWHQSGGTWISRRNDMENFDFKSQNNGVPGAEFITSNFLDGIHYIDEYGNAIEYGGSPDEKMQKFFDGELESKIKSYISSALLSAVGEYF